MLFAGTGLVLAWFCKALVMKDGLAEGLGNGEIQGQLKTEQTEQRWARHLTEQPWVRRLAEELAVWLADSSPPAKLAGAMEEDHFFFGIPLLEFAAERQDVRPGAWDMDPSYAGYLENQQLMEESRYFLLYGDENSQAEEPEEYEQDIVLKEITRLTPAYHIRKDREPSGTAYMVEQLMDYDFLMSHFYSVHSSTTASREELNAETLLAKDLSIEKDSSVPQILIYHTHSQEEFADWNPDNPEATVVGIGSYLTKLLTEKGYNVIHDVSRYDMMAGELDRNHAYNYALDGIARILQEHPSIQVVLDVHRDGVSENLHMVAEADGKQMAPIMFFNGMSQTPEGPVEYLPNPYREDNLAFSLQMQLDAAAYYPGLTRRIYLKGLRYNLHVRPRSALIEVGAQTNTYEEARNSMEPLAELLDMVLSGE